MDKHVCKAKRIDTGEWIFGYFIGISFDQSYLAVQNNNLATWRTYSVDPKTVCRCIGWKDSYKIPIFERDIVEFKCGSTSDRYLVCWCNEMNMLTAVPLDGIEFNGWDYWNGKYPQFEYPVFCLMMQDPYGDFSEIKVVGNIVDNTELMEGLSC